MMQGATMPMMREQAVSVPVKITGRLAIPISASATDRFFL
jgi:hypothetical protein